MISRREFWGSSETRCGGFAKASQANGQRQLDKLHTVVVVLLGCPLSQARACVPWQLVEKHRDSTSRTHSHPAAPSRHPLPILIFRSSSSSPSMQLLSTMVERTKKNILQHDLEAQHYCIVPSPLTSPVLDPLFSLSFPIHTVAIGPLVRRFSRKRDRVPHRAYGAYHPPLRKHRASCGQWKMSDCTRGRDMGWTSHCMLLHGLMVTSTPAIGK